MPVDEERYLASLVSRVRAELGEDLVGVYAGGSWALGAYEPGTSDLDVAVVARNRLPHFRLAALAKALRHDALPCPARGLELVVYSVAAVSSPSTTPGFDLNLNTGAGLPERIDFEPVSGETHWFAIDRSILAQSGLALYGRPAGDVFKVVPRRLLTPVLAEALRHGGTGAPAVLNACRTLRFVTDGVWDSKRDAAAWVLARGEERVLVEAALRVRAGRDESLDPAAVGTFVGRVLTELEA